MRLVLAFKLVVTRVLVLIECKCFFQNYRFVSPNLFPVKLRSTSVRFLSRFVVNIQSKGMPTTESKIVFLDVN